MKQQKKFSSQEQQLHVSETRSQVKSGHEFASVEEMLRYDASQTSPPPAIAARLEQSLQSEPGLARSWWRRWLKSE